MKQFKNHYRPVYGLFLNQSLVEIFMCKNLHWLSTCSMCGLDFTAYGSK